MEVLMVPPPKSVSNPIMFSGVVVAPIALEAFDPSELEASPATFVDL
jgi:hypothetical protein